jgi:homoserine kinase
MSEQMTTKTLSVFAPISIGNVSVGFDSLGLAVQPIDGSALGDTVHISNNDSNILKVSGSHVHCLPAEPEKNIVWDCLNAFNLALNKAGGTPVPVSLVLEKNIPVSSGLGSSACSVVAAYVALNEFYEKPFSEQQLLAMMAEQEGAISGSIHYDNIAPCYKGGLQLMTTRAEQPTIQIPVFEDCYWVMAYPDIEVSTRAARDILPTDYSRQTTIEFGQNLATFVAASYAGDKSLAMSVLIDILAEPHRQQLLPGYTENRQALMDIGALAVGISGSGPTIFCVTDDIHIAHQASAQLKAHYQNDNDSFVAICQVDTTGTRIINE